uniref:DUF6535 domain-containing protein n=1 Tax=Moniliophthora roreri TaxID=221103 RepID=A0A0W0FP02_MONRR
MVKNWKEDVDTLLVFAGLFSAVVTAFTTESYQWLVEDPANITVVLLTQISMQTASLTPLSSASRPDCLREQQRDTPTRTPGEALARQLCRDSFEKWGVSSFLSALPILLEVALLLFFVGVLDLLWNRHVISFALCFTAVTLSARPYFVTTVLPTVVVPHSQISNIRDCAFERLQLILRLLPFSLVSKFVEKHARGIWDHLNSPTSDWSSFDLQVVRQFDQDVMLRWSKVLNLKVYELRALEWAVTMFRDSPSMVPHLSNVLGTLPPSLAMSAVLGSWRVTMWKDVSASDVELRLRDSNTSSSERQEYIWWTPDPTLPSPLLHHSNGIRLIFRHQFWMTMARASQMQFYLSFAFCFVAIMLSGGL